MCGDRHSCARRSPFAVFDRPEPGRKRKARPRDRALSRRRDGRRSPAGAQSLCYTSRAFDSPASARGPRSCGCFDAIDSPSKSPAIAGRAPSLRPRGDRACGFIRAASATICNRSCTLTCQTTKPPPSSASGTTSPSAIGLERRFEVRKSGFVVPHGQAHDASAMLGNGANGLLFRMHDCSGRERLPTRRGGRIASLFSTMSDVERAATDAFVTTEPNAIHLADSLEISGFDVGDVHKPPLCPRSG